MSSGPRPRIGVITFPGSCDDRDAMRALALCGAEPVRVAHRDADPPALDGALVPGGFSYGDYLRPGAIARLSPAMEAVGRPACCRACCARTTRAASSPATSRFASSRRARRGFPDATPEISCGSP